MTVAEPLEPGGYDRDPDWNESLYTYWYDRAAGVAGWHRIAQRPNRGTVGTFTCIATPSGVRYRHHDEFGPFGRGARDGIWRGSGLELAWKGDDVQSLRYGSPDCDADLEWRGIHAIVDYRQVALGYDDHLADIAAAHVEQSGRITGVVRVGDEHYTVDALGHRDHSWGHRHLTSLLCTRWLIGTVGPQLSWSAAVVVVGDMVAEVGYVVRGDDVLAVRSFDIVLATEVDGLSYRRADAVLGLDDGTQLALVLDDVVAGGILRDQPWVGLECAATARVDGLVGVGNCETGSNITGGSNVPPMLVSGGAIGEGLSHPTVDRHR